MGYSFRWSSVELETPMLISISKLGISLNLTSINAIGSPEKVIIGFDEEAKVLGVAAASLDTPKDIKTYSLCTESRKGNAWIRIGCKNFIKYLTQQTGNDFSTSFKGDATIEEGVLLLKI